MLTFLMFAVLVLALVAALGLPYEESWHHRWGDYDR